MTALTAIFSTVAGARLGGTWATTSPGCRDVPASIRATRSSVGGTTGRPSVSPCWSRNSNGSRSAGRRIRRADSREASRRAASRRATSGSWTFDPQPGRASGSVSPARASAGAGRPQRPAASSTSASRSALTKPSQLASTCASPPASTRAGTASKPYSSETASSASSASGNVSPWRPPNAAVRAASSCDTPSTRRPDPDSARCARSTSGAVRSHVAQSCLKKKSSVAGAAGPSGPNPRASPAASRNANGAACDPGAGSVDMTPPV